MRLLLVDDEPDMLLMLGFVLRRAGYEVVTVHSGEVAVERVKNERFDLILTDLRMPGMSGYDTVAAIRKLDTKVTILVATGFATDRSADRCRALGANDLIRKPFDVDELRAVIGKLLSPLGKDPT